MMREYFFLTCDILFDRSATVESHAPMIIAVPSMKGLDDNLKPNLPKNRHATKESPLRCASRSELAEILKSWTPDNTATPPHIKTYAKTTSIRYLAISYRWKPPQAFLMTVTDPEENQWLSQSAPYNTLKACVDLATQHSIDWIWMDSLSINQSPTPAGKQDKSKYIPLMSSIYSMAFCVAAYTQDPNDSIFDTEWYNRVWTLQELVLPSQIFFYRNSCWTTLHEEQFFWATKGYKEDAKQAIGVLSELGGACKGTCLSLAQILKLLGRRGSLMEQDRVYGVLGLIPFPVNMTISYDVPVQTVWEDLCRQVVLKEGDLSMFATHRLLNKTNPPYWVIGISHVPEVAHGELIDWDVSLLNQKLLAESGKYVFTKSRLTVVERFAVMTSRISPSLSNSERAVGLLKKGEKDSTILETELDWICASFFVLQESRDSLKSAVGLGIFLEGCDLPFKTRIKEGDLPFKVGDCVRIVLLGTSGRASRGILGVDVTTKGEEKSFKPLCVVTCDNVSADFIQSDPISLYL
ncbi:hypothetical protein BDR26DRAFT_861837 [Obelidium mucronatum]|nr:hypothetical protein BDR26DRAFT_861837 [Obelidium mucronatum]